MPRTICDTDESWKSSAARPEAEVTITKDKDLDAEPPSLKRYNVARQESFVHKLISARAGLMHNYIRHGTLILSIIKPHSLVVLVPASLDFNSPLPCQRSSPSIRES